MIPNAGNQNPPVAHNQVQQNQNVQQLDIDGAADAHNPPDVANDALIAQVVQEEVDNELNRANQGVQGVNQFGGGGHAQGDGLQNQVQQDGQQQVQQDQPGLEGAIVNEPNDGGGYLDHQHVFNPPMLFEDEP